MVVLEGTVNLVLVVILVLVVEAMVKVPVEVVLLRQEQMAWVVVAVLDTLDPQWLVVME